MTESQAPDPTLDWTETVRRLTRVMVRALGADVGGAWLLSPGRDRFLPLAGYHVPKELVEAFSGSALFFGHPLIDEARRLEGPIYSEDSQADPRFDHPLLRLLPHKSVLALPMWLKGEVIGGFAMAWTREAHRFTPEELRLVEGVARQAAIAIENARLLEAEREARERLAVSEARYRELFENVIDIVFIHDLEGKILAINEAGARAGGWSREELLGMNIAQLMVPEDLARQAALIRRMIQGERVSEFFTAEFVRKDGSRGFLECSGRLVVKDGVPIAVQGVARDVTLRRRLEERQAAFVEIVKELAAEDDFGRLFSLIGGRFCELIGADSAVVSLVEGDEIVFRGSYGFDEPERATQRRKIVESRVGRVVLTRQPYWSSDMAADPHWRDSILVTRLGYRAILDVPIILRGEVIGVLGVMHKSPRTFSCEDVALLVSLAGHAAIALDRTSLVRELKARLQETRTLLTVSRAVGSTLDLTEVMRRVARETARVLGADMVGAFLADPDQQHLRPIAGYHVPTRLLEAFRTFPIPLKGHRALEEAWTHHRAVYSSDAAADPRVDRETLDRFPQRSTLFVPMIVKDKPIGGFFATWWEQKHDFTHEEVRIVEGISGQAAMAVENARLHEEAERRRRVAESLAEMGRLISHSLDPEVVEQQVVDSVRKLLGTQVATLYEPEPGSGDLVVRTLSGDRGPALRLGEVLPRDTGVMGMAMRQGRPVVTPNVLADPRITLPPDLRARIEQGPYRAVLAVPLLVKGRVVGALGIGDREGRVFDDEEIRLVRAFADHAAVALDNARLYREVSDHERILQALTDKLAKAQEEERKRVSREIHDELGQSLTAIKLSLEMLYEDLGDREEAARGRIAAAVAAVHDVLREMRRLSYDLRPFALDYLGLPAALRWHIDRFSTLTRIAVELSVEGQSRRLPPEIEIVLYRVTQEALRNLATHAKASRAWCRLRYRESSAELAITDDGQGFSPQTVLESAWKEGRLGLIGIRERVRSLGGAFLVAADRGGGTRLIVEFQDARPGFPEMPHGSGGGA